MSKSRTLRALVSRRLAAAAEEIFGLFERTIAEYEAERRDLLAGVYLRQLPAARADVQQLLVVEEEEEEEAVPPERQEWISGLDREDPEPPHIKEEPVELWTIQEGEQLQGLEEAGCFNFPLASVTVKIEDDAERECQSSSFPECQAEENREADEDVCGGSGSASNLDPGGPFQTATLDETSSSSSESETDGETSSSSSSSESETDSETPSSDSDVSCRVWEETGQPPSGSNPPDLPVGGAGCVEGARRFGHRGHQRKHSPVEVHSDAKRFSCPVCTTDFSSSAHLVRHMRAHTGEKPFSCSFCDKGFAHQRNLKQHLAIHTEEKPFSCSFCGKVFSHHSNLTQHLAIHTGEKPFSCSDCGRGFAQKEKLRQHMFVHTGEKPFSCSVCGRRFTQHGSMTRHMTVHTGEKPFSCSVCGRGFTQQSSLKRHLSVHRGETI